MVVRLSISSLHPSPSGVGNAVTLPGSNNFDLSSLALPAVVSSGTVPSQVAPGHSSSRSVPAGRKDLFCNPSKLYQHLPYGVFWEDFMQICFLHGLWTSLLGLWGPRQSNSTIRWSQPFVLIRDHNFVCISDTEIFFFTIRKLSPRSVLAYKSALVRPLRLAFILDSSS